MKPLLLLFAALPLLAQEPAPQPAPAENEPAVDKPELPRPAPRDDKLLDLLNKNPTPEKRNSGATEKSDPKKKDEAADDKDGQKKDPSRERGRTTLLPPKTATDLDLRIRYRKARAAAERDGAVIAAWEDSRKAHTDYAKREALKRYYTLIRAKVLAVDKGVSPMVEERHTYAMKRLDQTRVDPTDPLDEDVRHTR